jgi:hypothetical protein
LYEGLQTPESIEFLSYDKITKKQVKKYLKYVHSNGDGDTILIKHLGEEFILPKFEDRPQIIRLNHSDGHHPFRVTI